jgi:hypothetical protein
MLGVAAAYVDAVPGLTTPVPLAVGVASVASAVADIAVAKTALGGVAVGDLLVATPKINNTTPTWVSKAGDPAWTLKAQNNTTAGSACLFRIADGSEPANLTFTRSVATSGCELTVWKFQAGTFDPADPLFGVSFFAGSGDATLPSILAVPGPQRLLCQDVSRVVSATGESWTPPSAIEYYDTTAPTNNMQAAGGFEVVGAGATGTRFWDQTGTGNVRGVMFVVNPKP